MFADLTLSEPLENVAKLCHHVDRPLCDHLSKWNHLFTCTILTECVYNTDLIHEGDHWLFAYRYMVLYNTVEPSNPDTIGAVESVLISEVSLFQGLKSTQTWYLGRKKVSCLERCPYFRGVLIEGFHCICLQYNIC